MWKPVYLIIALMIGLLIWVSGSSLSPGWQGLLEGVIVIAGLGLVTFWLESAFIVSPSKKSGYTVYEYFSAGEIEVDLAEIFQPYPDSEEAAPFLVIDHRRMRDLVKEREEISKWSLN